MDDLVQQGIVAHKAGKRDEARKYFIAALKQNRDNERAWQFMYNVANDDKERLSCLQQILRINPQNEKAKALLNQLENIKPNAQTSINTSPLENVQHQTSQLKKCPYCAELIQEQAKVCRFCGRELTIPIQTSTPNILPKKVNWITIGVIASIVVIILIVGMMATTLYQANKAKNTPGSLEGVVSWQTQGSGNKFVVGVTVKVWANRTGGTESNNRF